MEHLRETEERLDALCREVRWRTRLNRVLRRGTSATAWALGLVALGMGADGLLLVSEPITQWCCLGAGAVWLVSMVTAWMHGLNDVSACQRLDQQAGLEGRLANARAFLSRDLGALSPMELAAVRDADKATRVAEPRAVSPLRRPPLSWGLGLACLGLLMTSAVTRTVGEAEAAGLRS
ncbi:MAG: hypothetical protein VX938_07170, partial [Myxococcota bacterium]|nr:hypothetical protein [Myxococcota bacterium]